MFKKIILFILLICSFVSASTEEEYNNCTCSYESMYYNLESKRSEDVISSTRYYGTKETPVPIPENIYNYHCDKYMKAYHHTIYGEPTGYKYYMGLGPVYLISAHINVHYEDRVYRCRWCQEPDIPFSENDKNATYTEQWKVDAPEAQENRQTCSENNGTIETAKITCVNYERCKIPNIPVCDQNDTKFPQIAENQKSVFSWNENDPDRTQECKDLKGNVQSKRTNCQEEYRCLIKTDSCKIEKEEQIGSYVSPRDSTFHEDITITGVEFGLHYSSENVDENQSKTVAYGWSFSNHAILSGNRLYLGSGELLVVEATQEENLTVVKTGSNELLFDSNGKHIQTRDLYTKEIETTFTYDTEDNLIGITNMYGEVTTINRDGNGIIISITAPYGQTTYFSIDENRDLIEVQYEDTSSYTFEYENHLMTLEREPNGNEFLHFFDEQGNVVKVIDAEQGEWDFGVTSDSTSGTHTVQRASGDTITYKKHFLENGVLKTEKILPTGDVILYENTVDDSRSSATTCGETSTNIYKLENGILAKDPIHDRRILESSTQTTPSGITKLSQFGTNYIFDSNQTLIKVEKRVSTNGATTTSLRDYNLSALTVTSPEGIVNTSTYDAKTQLLLSTKYADLEEVAYFYDDKGRVLETQQGNRKTLYAYDDKGNVATVTDPDKQTTFYSYDLLDRVIKITYPDGHSTQFEYDKNGNMTALITPTPTDHTFTYNGVNKKTGYTSPLQSSTTYTYDKQRRIIQIAKPSGASIDYTYVNGRITSIQTPEGTTDYNYACQSNVSHITRGDESLSFTYDGTLLTSMIQNGVLDQTIDYTYNNNFIIDSLTYAGSTTDYTYNKDNALIQSGSFTLERNSTNGLVEVLTDGLFTQKRDYNNFGELDRVEDGSYKYDLKRDKTKISSKKETITRYVANTNAKGKSNKETKPKKVKETHTYTYTYDNRDRLVEVQKDRQTVEKYSYDSNGNRASATVNSVTTTASYTLDDQLEVYGDNTYRYNDDGYLTEKTTSEGITTYEYGTLGELREVVTPTKTITYEHNANNQRVAKKVNGVIVEKYLWLDLTTLLAVYDKDDNLAQRFEYADQRMPVAMTQNDQKYYLHYDQVGSLRAVSDSSNNIIKEITYDTYGNILSDSNKAFKVPFGFAGGLYDSDTKLTRFGYRDYDAYTGKWTAKDPIGFDGGDTNLYGYVLGDPVNFMDPIGLKPFGDFKPFDPTFDLRFCPVAAAMGTDIDGCQEIVTQTFRELRLHELCKSPSISACQAACVSSDFYSNLKKFCKPKLKKPKVKKCKK